MSRYIDADALLEKVQFRVRINDDTDKTIKQCVEITRNLIENAPTADVEPVVHGHYVFDDDGDSSCSVCREKYLDHTQKYCPNCGAKLDGEDGKADGTI